MSRVEMLLEQMAQGIEQMARRLGGPPTHPHNLPGLENPLEGAQYSGFCRELLPGGKASVLRARKPANIFGMASVHVQSQDVGPPTANPTPNQRLVLAVSWQNARSGGECLVDAQRGTVFTVGGADSINIDAMLLPRDVDGVVDPGNSKRVECTVHWGGSISPRPALFTSPAVIAGPLLAPSVPIPLQASSMIALSPTPAALAGLTAQFAAAPVGGPLIYATTNPNANGTPIVHGAESVTFVSPVLMTVIPCWELWL